MTFEIKRKYGRGETIVFKEIDILNSDKTKKVQSFKRKSRGDTYESPKVILSSPYNAFIGEAYRTYYGKVEIASSYSGTRNRIFIMLVFEKEDIPIKKSWLDK